VCLTRNVHNVPVMGNLLQNEVRSEVAFALFALVVAAIVQLLIAGYVYHENHISVPEVQLQVVTIDIELALIGLGSLVSVTLSWVRRYANADTLPANEVWLVAKSFLLGLGIVIGAVIIILLIFSVWNQVVPDEWLSIKQQLTFLGHAIINDAIGLAALACCVSMAQKVRTLG
jgi:hypothetical protein